MHGKRFQNKNVLMMIIKQYEITRAKNLFVCDGGRSTLILRVKFDFATVRKNHMKQPTNTLIRHMVGTDEAGKFGGSMSSHSSLLIPKYGQQ
jgi:hypothetical protein